MRHLLILSIIAIILASCAKQEQPMPTAPKPVQMQYSVIGQGEYIWMAYRINEEVGQVFGVFGVDTLKVTLKRNDRLQVFPLTDYPGIIRIERESDEVGTWYYPYNYSDTITIRATW